MDPAATLRWAVEALAWGDLEGADEALGHYRDWRRRGGFQPPGGDERAADLRRRLADARRS